MNKGFTLIELMIVVAIIAIIAAIAIPSLISSKMSAQETGAAQTLKSLASTEATWQNVDTDRNGIKDFWVVDLSGFYRVQDATGNPAQVLDISFARSDWVPVAAGGATPVVGALLTATGAEPVAKSGYYYCAFQFSDAGVTAYARDLDSGGDLFENTSSYAFQAFPDKYGSSGKLAFIMNESASVFKIEAITPEGATGNNAALTFNDTTTFVPLGTAGVVATGVSPMPNWPATNPTSAGYASVE